MKEYSDLISVVLAIFVTLLIGAYFSPSFEEQKTFLQTFLNLAVLLFAFTLLVVVAYIGFQSFALYMAVFIAMVLFMVGVYAVVLVVGVSYFIWGFIFGFEALLVGHKVASAQEWFKGRYTYQSFYREYLVFYPMIMLVYTIVEVLPCLLGFEKPKRFKPNEILKQMQEILE